MPKIKLVILGSGFGAFRVAMGISTSMYDVTVVSPRDHFLFTPLLASTTVGTTEFRSIIEPVRYSQKGVRSFTAHCSNIDTPSKTIHCVSTVDRDADFTLTYDVLVIAIGVVSADYGIPGVNEFALPIKELGDARRIRQQIITSIERATLPDITPEEQDRLLTFVIVGGGPTGVEFAGQLHDFIRQDLSAIFPELRGKFKIKLLDAGPTLLNAFDRSLGEYTKRIFRKRDIEILTSAPVKEVRHEEVVLEDGTVLPF
ncbi:MAG: FAD-dependent oxidoreductase, partial [Deltaproteobacteria bacterium]|nr:FAD-dependent oxidoreductase [Deltaproteobacteria bacterium]